MWYRYDSVVATHNHPALHWTDQLRMVKGQCDGLACAYIVHIAHGVHCLQYMDVYVRMYIQYTLICVYL